MPCLVAAAGCAELIPVSTGLAGAPICILCGTSRGVHSALHMGMGRNAAASPGASTLHRASSGAHRALCNRGQLRTLHPLPVSVNAAEQT